MSDLPYVSPDIRVNPRPAATLPEDGGLLSSLQNWMGETFNKESMFGADGQGGWVAPVATGAQALGNFWRGMQQYGLAKDSLKEQKRQFAQNFDAQRRLTNSRLEDRQRARVASNPGAYESVEPYMEKNRIR